MLRVDDSTPSATVDVGDEPLHLTRNEVVVLRELARLETGTEDHRLSGAYRRILELVRSQHGIDGVLAAHLIRDFQVAFAARVGGEITRVNFEYVDAVEELAGSWPPELRGGEPPESAIIAIRRLLQGHDAASGRSERIARHALQRGNPEGVWYVPGHSIQRWRSLSRESSGLAHRLKNPDKAMPEAAAGRRLAEELTATLLAAVGPYLAGIDEIDAYLSMESPDEDAASRLAALLRTPAQEAYFFHRARAAWLRPPAAVRGLLASPLPLVEGGDGTLRMPGWPQARFLARLAPDHSELVLQCVSMVRQSDNPMVADGMVDIARALPVTQGRKLVPWFADALTTPLVVDYLAVDAVAFACDLATGGFPDDAVTLLVAVVKAATGSRRAEWELEQALGRPVDVIVAAGGKLAPPLAKLLRHRIGAMGPVRRHSTIWLRRVTHPPRYGSESAWQLANALYRVLLAMDEAGARELVKSWSRHSEIVLRRIALAAVAARPGLAAEAHEILDDPAKFDDESTSRHEFRAALLPIWEAASEAERATFLAYADRADEADEIATRLASIAYEGPLDPADIRVEWQRRLLAPIRELLAVEWDERLGLPGPIPEDDPEPVAEWIGPISPISPIERDELAAMAPADLLHLLRTWTPPAVATFRAPTAEGLAVTAAQVIASRAHEFEGLSGDLASLDPPAPAAIIGALRDHRRPPPTARRARRRGPRCHRPAPDRSGCPCVRERQRDAAGAT